MESMNRGKLLNRLHLLADYATKDKQVALSRAQEVLAEYTLSRDGVIRNAYNQIKQAEPVTEEEPVEEQSA